MTSMAAEKVPLRRALPGARPGNVFHRQADVRTWHFADPGQR